MANERPPRVQGQSTGVATDAPPPGFDPQLTNDRGFFGHPRGLSTLFFTEMWERFSYYGLRPLLVLFMAAALIDGGFGFSREQASAIVGLYGFSVYLASLPPGDGAIVVALAVTEALATAIEGYPGQCHQIDGS